MIIAYTGLPGSGKTYSLAADCIGTMKKYGTPVWANFALAGAHYFSDLKQVLEVERGIIAVDEMNSLCPSWKWQSVPPEYANLWTQSRHNDIDLLYTTQEFEKVVTGIRGITNYVWEFDWMFGSAKPREEKKWRHFFHVARRYRPCDVGRIRRSQLEKYWFMERVKVYKTYNTKFKVRTPDYLKSIEGIDLAPDNLPIFNEQLKLDPKEYEV